MTSTTFFIIFIPILAILLLAINLILAPHNPYQEKDSVFECGFHSFLGQNRTQFSISFFIFGILFLIFDLEIVLLFPFALSGYNNDIYGLAVVMVFFILLTLGFIFELGKNALTIDSRQTFSYKSEDTAIPHLFMKGLSLQGKRVVLESNLSSVLQLLLYVTHLRVMYCLVRACSPDDTPYSLVSGLILAALFIVLLAYTICFFNRVSFKLTLWNKFFIFFYIILAILFFIIPLLEFNYSLQLFFTKLLDITLYLSPYNLVCSILSTSYYVYNTTTMTMGDYRTMTMGDYRTMTVGDCPSDIEDYSGKEKSGDLVFTMDRNGKGKGRATYVEPEWSSGNYGDPQGSSGNYGDPQGSSGDYGDPQGFTGNYGGNYPHPGNTNGWGAWLGANLFTWPSTNPTPGPSVSIDRNSPTPGPSCPIDRNSLSGHVDPNNTTSNIFTDNPIPEPTSETLVFFDRLIQNTSYWEGTSEFTPEFTYQPGSPIPGPIENNSATPGPSGTNGYSPQPQPSPRTLAIFDRLIQNTSYWEGTSEFTPEFTYQPGSPIPGPIENNSATPGPSGTNGYSPQPVNGGNNNVPVNGNTNAPVNGNNNAPVNGNTNSLTYVEVWNNAVALGDTSRRERLRDYYNDYMAATCMEANVARLKELHHHYALTYGGSNNIPLGYNNAPILNGIAPLIPRYIPIANNSNGVPVARFVTYFGDAARFQRVIEPIASDSNNTPIASGPSDANLYNATVVKKSNRTKLSSVIGQMPISEHTTQTIPYFVSPTSENPILPGLIFRGNVSPSFFGSGKVYIGGASKYMYLYDFDTTSAYFIENLGDTYPSHFFTVGGVTRSFLNDPTINLNTVLVGGLLHRTNWALLDDPTINRAMLGAWLDMWMVKRDEFYHMGGDLILVGDMTKNLDKPTKLKVMELIVQTQTYRDMMVRKNKAILTKELIKELIDSQK